MCIHIKRVGTEFLNVTVFPEFAQNLENCMWNLKYMHFNLFFSFFFMIFTYYVILGVIFTLFCAKFENSSFDRTKKIPLLECLGGDLIINRIYASSQTCLK